MNIELGKYRLNIPYIQNWLKSTKESNIHQTATEISVAINLPIIVTYNFIGEIQGFTPDILEKIERLKKFYLIDEVVE